MRSAAILLVVLTLASTTRADERLKGIACRSVHFGYPAPAGDVFYNEVTVDKSAPGTYFMVCGFDAGYFGIQELADGKKVVLFSIWDPGRGNDPQAVADEQRVKLLDKDESVRVGRFGGEGTGGQSFLDFAWKIGETYRFAVRSRPDGERTAYSGYLYLPEQKAWKRLVTFSTRAGGKSLRGYYSFVEDFRRNKTSATQQRQARFGNGWVRASDGAWIALTRARFTADANPVTNIDARLDGERFVLVTGGETINEGAKLNSVLTRSPPGLDLPPDLR